jgi:hypothetical protein
MTKPKPEMIHFVDDHHGVYVPRQFARSWSGEERERRVSGVNDDEWAILEAGPDNELYWDVWADVEQSARVTDDNGNVFAIHNDGGCFLVPIDMEWSDEAQTFVWPEENGETDVQR